MTEAEKTNLEHTFRVVIDKATSKHRRENVIPPTPAEYLDAWVEALRAAASGILQPRRPGRPKRKDKYHKDISDTHTAEIPTLYIEENTPPG